MNRWRRAGVHGGMNRPNMYIKQAHAMVAWFRAQGDQEGADLADSLAEHLNVNHEAVDDQTTPDWTVVPGPDALDTEPAIRCWPEVGCVFEGEDGPILTIDPMDGGDVSIVHMGDVVKWMSIRIGADEEKARATGEAQAQLDAERQAYDATVGSGYKDAHQARDYHARLLAEANDSDWEETIGAVETAAAADHVSDRDIEHELDAQADAEDEP